MAIDARSAARDIMAAVREADVQPRRAAGRMTRGSKAGSAPSEFCTVWPQARPVLETVAGIASFIPGMGSVAGGVLRGLLVVGDKIAKEVCE